MHSAIHYLKNKQLLWRANDVNSAHSNTQTTGFSELDSALQGGFPDYGVIDIRSPIGIGELRLLLPNIVNKQKHSPANLSVFIAPPLGLNAEMLAEIGLKLEQVMIIQPKANHDNLWAAEQSLKSGCCNSVVLWHSMMTVAQIKRLQLAAEKGHSQLFILRIPQQNDIPLPVSLGMQLQANHLGIQVDITKRKGPKPNEPFVVNMHTYWPELIRTEKAQVVNLTFPVSTLPKRA
jgi:cell division inhibitor SulA